MNKKRGRSDFWEREWLNMKVLCLIKEVVFYYLDRNGKPLSVFKQMSYIVSFREVAAATTRPSFPVKEMF